MRLTWEEWHWWTRGSVMRRATYAGFKRNVAVAMGNWLAAWTSRGGGVAALVDPLPDEWQRYAYGSA